MLKHLFRRVSSVCASLYRCRFETKVYLFSDRGKHSIATKCVNYLEKALTLKQQQHGQYRDGRYQRKQAAFCPRRLLAHPTLSAQYWHEVHGKISLEDLVQGNRTRWFQVEYEQAWKDSGWRCLELTYSVVADTLSYFASSLAM